jgi:hypothetical protein
MIEEKKRKLERKEAKKIKEMKKQEALNLTSLRQEIYAYQFRLASQPIWNKSFITRAERFSIRIKDKDQVSTPPEVKG